MTQLRKYRKQFRLARFAVNGFVLGVYFWLMAMACGINFAVGYAATSFILYSGTAFALVGLTKLRKVLWIPPAGITIVFLLVGYTPIMRGPALNLIRTDPLQKADAIVVLSAGVTSDNLLNYPGLDRILGGVELVKQGWSTNLVLTRIGAPDLSGEADQDRVIGLVSPQPNLFRVGKVINTHDEALLVAQLAKEHSWKTIIMVTSPLHSSRAAATLEKTGLTVISRPCDNRQYAVTESKDTSGNGEMRPPLSTVEDRLSAFEHLSYETLGWWSYRRKGFVKP